MTKQTKRTQQISRHLFLKAQLSRLLLSLFVATSMADHANAQTSDWTSVGPVPGANGPVYATVVDSVGNLYIGGAFTSVAGVAANGIAKWNGSSWSALGAGMGGGPVFALAV